MCRTVTGENTRKLIGRIVSINTTYRRQSKVSKFSVSKKFPQKGICKSIICFADTMAMCPWTNVFRRCVRPLENKSLERYVPSTICPLDDTSLRRIVPGTIHPWTMRPLDDSSHGRYIPWTMRHLWRFVPDRFAPGDWTVFRLWIIAIAIRRNFGFPLKS
jgi:hypothetical protein